MKLRSITLTNVRRFAGQRAVLSGIGDGLTVVSEANEFGKSTFFDALHALFFEKFGATAQSVKSLQPYAGGQVRVAAGIETDDGLFTVEKRWLSQKGASVTDAAGRLVATDGDAEAWIGRLIGDSRDGPAGLLWVKQGAPGLEPAGSRGGDRAGKERLTETRRDSAVLGRRRDRRDDRRPADGPCAAPLPRGSRPPSPRRPGGRLALGRRRRTGPPRIRQNTRASRSNAPRWRSP